MKEDRFEVRLVDLDGAYRRAGPRRGLQYLGQQASSVLGKELNRGVGNVGALDASIERHACAKAAREPLADMVIRSFSPICETSSRLVPSAIRWPRSMMPMRSQSRSASSM